MAKTQSQYGFDGTTGKSNYGGRRTHIIQLLRDSREPLSVTQVAEAAGVHINTARFHLESLVDSGLADRRQEPRSTPGRPKVLYVGTLPNQTHERAQGYRLLAEALTVSAGQMLSNPEEALYDVGVQWGSRLAHLDSDSLTSQADILSAVLAKLDALWFAPELISKATSGKLISAHSEAITELNRDYGLAVGQQAIVLHHAPFLDATTVAPRNVCALNAGLLNGLLQEQGSTLRVESIHKEANDYHSVALLSKVDADTWAVNLDITTEHDR